MLGTDRDKELHGLLGLLYDRFDQDKLIGYGIAYLEELRSRLNERVIDDDLRPIADIAPVGQQFHRGSPVDGKPRTMAKLPNHVSLNCACISARRSSNTLITAS